MLYMSKWTHGSTEKMNDELIPKLRGLGGIQTFTSQSAGILSTSQCIRLSSKIGLSPEYWLIFQNVKINLERINQVAK